MVTERDLKIDPVTFVCSCGFTYGPENPTGTQAAFVERSRDEKWRAYRLLARKDGVPIVGEVIREVSEPASGKSEIECPACERRSAWGGPHFPQGGVAFVSGREPRAFSWLTEDPLDE